MKTPLFLCVAAAVAGASFAACSDEGGADRPTGGGGSGGQTSMAGSTGNMGGSSGSPGGGGSAGAMGGPNYGPALVISDLDGANVPITDSAGSTGINGAAYLVQSMTMGGMITTQATLTGAGGKVCMAGSTVPVPPGPNGDNYTEYWGAEIDFDLNRVDTAAAVIGDAGADAGDAGPAPLGMEAGPWDPGNVIGFSFVIDGPTMPTAFRFKSRPVMAATSENFCVNVPTPITSGAVQNFLFTDIRRDCWNSPGEAASLFQDPAGYSQLLNLGWQVPAQLLVGIPFDFCVSQIKPILRP